MQATDKQTTFPSGPAYLDPCFIPVEILYVRLVFFIAQGVYMQPSQARRHDRSPADSSFNGFSDHLVEN